MHGRARRCRRRQILDHFGDAEPGRPTGRCCDVCDPDAALRWSWPSSQARGFGGRRRGGADAPATGGAPALRGAGRRSTSSAFERLRAWRIGARGGQAGIHGRRRRGARRRCCADARAATAELIEIKGIGPAFCEKHGESLLAELAGLEAQLDGEGAGEGGSSDHASGEAAAPLASGAAPT